MGGRRSIVFLGTPAAAVTVLDALVSAGHDIPLVVSRADARRGRGGALSPSPVKSRALELGLVVSDRLDDVRAVAGGDGVMAVVVAYGRIIPADILGLMPMVNVHFSLLPRWRGAAPVERAILAGDGETGVCIMKMEEGLDTGAVYASRSTPIGAGENSAELTERLAHMGAALLCELLRDDLPSPVQQTGDSTYARKITTDDALINWDDSRDSILRRVRAVSAFTQIEGKRLRVVSAESAERPSAIAMLENDATVGASDGTVRLLRVQPEGKGPMAADEWLRGLKRDFPVRLG